jgi:hypothetical protein
MWDVENATRYAHAHSWDRDKTGADTWIVVVKGTFLILPDGSTTVADQQPPVCTVPEYLGAPGQSSLRLDTDLVRVKPTTDVVVWGHAYAPNGRPAKQVDVTLRTNAFEKTLRVFGDRQWKRGLVGLTPSEPEPFVRMPIVYERAFGGADRRSAQPSDHTWDERNPVGVGFARDATQSSPGGVPNVEYPSEPLSSSRQRPRPAGFGPIPPHWMPRRQWAGTYDAEWEQERKPLAPDDMDDRFFLCAPPDQQPPTHLRGGEVVELLNMTPGGALRFHLPRVVLGFETLFESDEPTYHRPVLHTVIIEPDTPRVSLVWQTTLQCHAKVLKLDFTRVTEKVRL